MKMAHGWIKVVDDDGVLTYVQSRHIVALKHTRLRSERRTLLTLTSGALYVKEDPELLVALIDEAERQ